MRISRTLMHIAALVSYLVLAMATDSLGSQDRPPKKYTETITTQDGQKLSFEMVLIPSGTFLMGSPQACPERSRRGEAGRQDHEGPQHQVCLDPFYLCTTETTIELFLAYYNETVSTKKDFFEVEQAKKNAEQAGRDLPASGGRVDAITGPTPVYGDLTMGYGQKHPAIGMTWHNAVTFCTWLSRKTGRQYRLPTEAEWEYACRAGASSPAAGGQVFGFADPCCCRGKLAPVKTGDPNRLADFAWYEANSDGETHEVAKKKPNTWGLYDMSGNVREWVYDFYSCTAYKDAPASSCRKTGAGVNPKGPKTSKVHVARGGDYDSSSEELRCAARAFEEEWWRSGDPQIPKSKWWLPGMDFIGFRVASSASVRTPRKTRG